MQVRFLLYLKRNKNGKSVFNIYNISCQQTVTYAEVASYKHRKQQSTARFILLHLLEISIFSLLAPKHRGYAQLEKK